MLHLQQQKKTIEKFHQLTFYPTQFNQAKIEFHVFHVLYVEIAEFPTLFTESNAALSGNIKLRFNGMNENDFGCILISKCKFN